MTLQPFIYYGEDEKHCYMSVGYHTQYVKIKNVFSLEPFIAYSL